LFISGAEWRLGCVKPQRSQRFKRFFLDGLIVLCGEEGFLLTSFATPLY
jgi:hypothetical protein